MLYEIPVHFLPQIIEKFVKLGVFFIWNTCNIDQNTQSLIHTTRSLYIWKQMCSSVIDTLRSFNTTWFYLSVFIRPEFLRSKHRRRKWTQTALVWRLICFCSNCRTILKSTVLFWRCCNRRWSQSSLNAKNRYMGVTKFHKSIPELNNSNKSCQWQ